MWTAKYSLVALVIMMWMQALPAHAQVTRVLPQTAEQMQLSFAGVSRSAAPAVVNVYATTVTQQSTSPFANDPFFQQFFGRNSPFFGTRPQTSQSLGSGVIVDANGLILTNSHVVRNATDIRVTMNDGQELEVDLILDDVETDLAVLQVRGNGAQQFPFLAFANSDALEVGDLVLAIGNPFGVGQTVTSGIISALARTGLETADYDFFIQTDAAINPGNSGGALVDMQGNLVGINTAIFTRSGGSVGIGFAIPANLASVVAQSGQRGETKVARAWLGAKLQVVTPDIARGLGLLRPIGALLADIAPDGPAEKAGLLAGDVVLGVDGIAIRDPGALEFRLATKQVGGRSQLDVSRQGQRLVIEIDLTDVPYGLVEQAGVKAVSRFQGAEVAMLTPQLAEAAGLPYSAQGVVVLEIGKGTAAEELGLRQNDVIVTLNDQDMRSLNQFINLASTQPELWLVKVNRAGRILRSRVPGR